MVDEHVFDLLPGYALACLDEQDLLQVSRHLPHCPICRAELETYWATADQLAFSLLVQVPPDRLKVSLMKRIQEAEAGSAVPRTDSIAAQEQRAAPDMRADTRGGGGIWQSLANFFRANALAWGVLALLLVLALSISNLLMWQQVRDIRSRVPVDEVNIVKLVGTENAPQATGYLMVFEEENYGTLVVEHAPELDAGYQYQLWLIKDGQRISGGVFSVDEDGYGVLEIESNEPLSSYPTFGVTIEPEGGSPGPTGSRVLFSDL